MPRGVKREGATKDGEGGVTKRVKTSTTKGKTEGWMRTKKEKEPGEVEEEEEEEAEEEGESVPEGVIVVEGESEESDYELPPIPFSSGPPKRTAEEQARVDAVAAEERARAREQYARDLAGLAERRWRECLEEERRAREAEQAAREAAFEKTQREELEKRLAEERALAVRWNAGTLRRATHRIAREVHDGLASGTIKSWRYMELLRQLGLPQHRVPRGMSNPLLFSYGNAFLCRDDEMLALSYIEEMLKDPTIAPAYPAGIGREHYQADYELLVLGPEVANRLSQSARPGMSLDEIDAYRKGRLSFDVWLGTRPSSPPPLELEAQSDEEGETEGAASSALRRLLKALRP